MTKPGAESTPLALYQIFAEFNYQKKGLVVRGLRELKEGNDGILEFRMSKVLFVVLALGMIQIADVEAHRDRSSMYIAHTQLGKKLTGDNSMLSELNGQFLLGSVHDGFVPHIEMFQFGGWTPVSDRALIAFWPVGVAGLEVGKPIEPIHIYSSQK